MRRRGFWEVRKLSEAGFTGDLRDWGTCDESHDYEQED